MEMVQPLLLQNVDMIDGTINTARGISSPLLSSRGRWEN
jgi:hypothetical protein